MQDVKNTMDEYIEREDALRSDRASGDFTLLSQRWASHALATYRDELLTKALAIAKALSEFDAELFRDEEVEN